MTRSIVRYLPVLFIVFAFTVFAEESKDLLSYRTFIDYANKGMVKSVVISDFNMKDIKATILKDDSEVTYYIDIPYQASDFSLLSDFLNVHNK